MAMKSTVQPAPRIATRVATLEWEIERLQAKLEIAKAAPLDEYDNGAVITFQKKFNTDSPVTYTYVALKAGHVWYLTGTSVKFTWDQLIDHLYGNVGEGGSVMAFWVSEITEIV